MKIEGMSAKISLDSSVTKTIKGPEETKVPSTEQQNDKLQQKNGETLRELTKEDAEHIVDGLNEFLKPKLKSLSFQLHEELNRYYVQVIDQESKEVIREIPQKELLDMYAKMTEYLGLFIDEKL